MQSDEIPLGYTRVTEILEPYKNFDNIPVKVLEKARIRGDEVHEFCNLYALKMLIKKPSDEVKPYFDSFKIWHDSYVSKTLITEMRILDANLLIAGKPDWVGTLKGSYQIVLGDWKTPKIHDPSWILQSAAYKYLLRIALGINVERRICVQLDKDGKPPVVTEYLNHDHDERLFLNQHEIYRFFHPKIK